MPTVLKYATKAFPSVPPLATVFSATVTGRGAAPSVEEARLGGDFQQDSFAAGPDRADLDDHGKQILSRLVLQFFLPACKGIK